MDKTKEGVPEGTSSCYEKETNTLEIRKKRKTLPAAYFLAVLLFHSVKPPFKGGAAGPIRQAMYVFGCELKNSARFFISGQFC